MSLFLGKIKCLYADLIDIMLFLTEHFLVKFQLGRKAELSIADLIMNNSRSGELLRYDIIIRYLAIEEYYNKNDYGFRLYEKMQSARVAGNTVARRVDTFKKLIKSYEEKGYDDNSRIAVYGNIELLDGSHRIAMALYHDLPTINALIIGVKRKIGYSIDWFIANGFSNEEVGYIINKYQDIIGKINLSFSCVIWSPAIKFTDEIVEDLKFFGDVVSIRKHTYEKNEYERVVRDIYAVDDIKEWKIEKKLEYMGEYSPECVEIDIIFKDPEYRIKKSTGLLLSSRGERIKKAIREKYRKKINNYFFDIIIHIGDNIYQSEYMRHVFNDK